MKKKIRDITFAEFSDWVNQRACDGQWSMLTATVCMDLGSRIHKETRHVVFGKKKKREELFQQYKGEYLNLDAEIDIF